jgi:deoxycytidine triphosphate deaminase/intein/homing endonuclease
MILSDRDLRALIESGSLVIEPFDPAAVQPSSVDLRVGTEFRVFANSRHPYIDVRKPMEGLTEVVHASEDEPFILHPGEFVLGSTLERVALPDDKVGRLEGKSSLGRLGLLIHSSLPVGEPVLFRDSDGVTSWRPIDEIVRKSLEGEVVAFDPDSFETSFHAVTGRYEGPADRIFEVVLASGRKVKVTAGHNLFTLDRDGRLVKVRTGELSRGVLVAIPGAIPDSRSGPPVLNLSNLAPESDLRRLVYSGTSVQQVFEDRESEVSQQLKDRGIGHVSYYRDRTRLPAVVARQFVDIESPDLQVSVRGSGRSLPNRVAVDCDFAWLLGLYVAEGYRRDNQVVWSNTDQEILDRVERILHRHDLPVYRQPGAITCSSALLSLVVGWIGVGDGSHHKRIPPMVFAWPDDLIKAFVEGFVDGDGSRETTRISLWSSSELLVSDFLALLPRVGLRAGASKRSRGKSQLFQISVPHREHKLLTSVPLADRLLVHLRDMTGWSQVDASRRLGFSHPTDLCNIENRTNRDAVRAKTIRRFVSAYGGRLRGTKQFNSLRRLVDGDVLWDRVVEVRDLGVEAPIFDLEVCPGGRKIENFLAGRGGVFVSNTAGFVDAGFNGYLTLELSNVANLPITIYPGMKIGQLCLFDMTSPAERPYGSDELGSKYHGQVGPTPSRYFENFEDTDE